MANKLDVLRKHVINDSTMQNLINDNVFLVDKPQDQDIKCDNYIIYNYKELSGGYTTDYSVEFDVIGKDLSLLLTAKDRLIELFDDPRNNKIIKDDKTTILTSNLVNGGGIVRNPDTGNYSLIIYFQIKIKGVC